METSPIDLSANLRTAPCKASLEPHDPSLFPERLGRIARFLRADPQSLFVFTSSGAEAINQVIWSVFFTLARTQGKTHFITTLAEDAPTLQMMKRLEDLGCFVKIAPLNSQGIVDLEKLKELINPRTALISVAMAQGLTGVIQPVEEIARLGKERGVLVHVDGTYSAGKYDFSLQDLDVDYFTFAGDRIHSTIATGGIFAKKQAPLVPLIVGGKGLLRGGSVDIAGALALSAAADQASLFFDAMALEVARLRNLFEKELLRLIPEAEVLFKTSYRLPNTTTISFPRVHQEALHSLLKRKKIDTWIGGEEAQHLYPILIASNVDPITAASAISFSFSRMTTEEEIRKAALVIQEAVLILQRFAPLPPFHLPVFDPHTYILGKKLREKVEKPQFVGSFASAHPGMRLVSVSQNNFHLHALIDESDGVVADVKFQAFGPLALIAAGEIACELMMRKTHLQVSRISADLLDQHGRDKKDIPAFSSDAHGILNQVISAIDAFCEQVSDIECASADYDATPIAWEGEESGGGIADWATFSSDKKMSFIEAVIAKEIRPYIELDQGGINVLQLNEKDELTIAYQGACTTCHSSTGSTLSAIQNILRARLSPSIRVIPSLEPYIYKT